MITRGERQKGSYKSEHRTYNNIDGTDVIYSNVLGYACYLQYRNHIHYIRIVI